MRILAASFALVLMLGACSSNTNCNRYGTCTQTVQRRGLGGSEYFDGVSQRQCDWFSCREYMSYTNTDTGEVYTSNQEWITDDLCQNRHGIATSCPSNIAPRRHSRVLPGQRKLIVVGD